MSCVFCGVACGDIDAEIIYSDESCVAFRDLDPMAPVHILIIPREHIESLETIQDDQIPILGRLGAVARDLARDEGIAEDGYRLVLNCNASGGQTVFHLHMHLLGGRRLLWPPG